MPSDDHENSDRAVFYDSNFFSEIQYEIFECKNIDFNQNIRFQIIDQMNFFSKASFYLLISFVCVLKKYQITHIFFDSIFIQINFTDGDFHDHELNRFF